MCECERRCFQMQAEWSTWNLQYVSLLKCTAHNRSVGCGSVCRLILTGMGEREKKMCSVFAPDKHRKKMNLYKDIVIIFVYLFWGWQQQCSANCLTTVHSVSYISKKNTGIWRNRSPSGCCFFCLFILFFFSMTKKNVCVSWKWWCRPLGRPSVQSQSMLVGASRVLCCVVDVYGMQHLSWLSFTVEMSFWIITRWVTLCRAKTISADTRGAKLKTNRHVRLSHDARRQCQPGVPKPTFVDLLALIYQPL